MAADIDADNVADMDDCWCMGCATWPCTPCTKGVGPAPTISKSCHKTPLPWADMCADGSSRWSMSRSYMLLLLGWDVSAESRAPEKSRSAPQLSWGARDGMPSLLAVVVVVVAVVAVACDEGGRLLYMGVSIIRAVSSIEYCCCKGSTEALEVNVQLCGWFCA